MMATAAPDLTPATWLPPALPALNAAIVRRAHRLIGIEELSPNRSGLIDEWNRRATAPLGSPWCASFTTAVYEDCGAAVPPSSRASCDVLRTWAIREGLWHSEPIEGAMVLYGRKLNGRWVHLASGQPDAVHVEIVVRLLPRIADRIRVVGGNTSFSGFSAEGIAVVYKPAAADRILGFIHPRAA